LDVTSRFNRSCAQNQPLTARSERDDEFLLSRRRYENLIILGTIILETIILYPLIAVIAISMEMLTRCALADSGSPDANRYAPRPEDNVPYYNVSTARLKEIRSEFMYWFFDKGGHDGKGDYQAALQSTTPQIHKNLNFQLPFFGFRFNYTRVRSYFFFIIRVAFTLDNRFCNLLVTRCFSWNSRNSQTAFERRLIRASCSKRRLKPCGR